MALLPSYSLAEWHRAQRDSTEVDYTLGTQNGVAINGKGLGHRSRLIKSDLLDQEPQTLANPG